MWMRVNGASRNLHERPIQRAPFAGSNNQRFSALFERQRKQIDRLERDKSHLERENERLQRELQEEKKRIAELEKENSKLKRDLDAKTPQADKPDSLSTPSGMLPVYSKPPARKRSRKPGRKKGHPGVRRTVPVHIDLLYLVPYIAK
jgi:hypothetical protein